VLFEVLSQVYGPEKQETAKLSPTVISERTGLARPNVSRGLAFLLKNGVIVRDGLDAYRFVKDYEAWASEGVPLVPSNLSEYAIGTPGRLKKKGTFIGPKPGRKPGIEMDNRFTGTDDDNPFMGVNRLSKNDDSRIHFDTPPPISENREVVVVAGEPSKSVPVLGSDNAPSAAASHLGPDGKPLIWAQRPFKPDPAELERAKDMVDAIDPHQYLRQKVQYLSASYPLEWIVEAFVRSSGKADRIANLANDTLIRWWKQGFMDEIEVSGPKAPRQLFPPAVPAAPRLTAYQAKEAAEKAKMKDYVPPSLRGERKS
jgi:hypothetical protein